MNSAVLGVSGLILFVLAYRFYGRWISSRLFSLEQLDNDKVPTPAHSMRDDIDYVPTKKGILVGHHFSSIAGAAPIVGPAVAAIWGWLPAVTWIIFGVIFMGACHDFGTLVLSMKHKGNSIAYVSEKLLGPRVRTLFLIIIFFLVWMVIAVFALVIANLFIKFPSSVIPINFEIIIALAMGYFINKKGKSLTLPSIIAQACLVFMIILGSKFPISIEPFFGENQLLVWMLFLLLYSFIASILPVWVLLQPRDYINSHQLVMGLGLMIIGLIIVQPTVVAPALNLHAEGAPPWFPFLFMTIACGAISGFHGLVSGGTTSKQVANWKDAKVIGYGSMLGEGLLALLATLAVTTGFQSSSAWHSHYANWNLANGLSAKISAFVIGAGNFVSGVGIPTEISQTVIAVLIISFAATSLDTACRIQRYIVGEFGKSLKLPSLENKYVGSGVSVISAMVLMFSTKGGKGGLQIWPLFGATNQMLAGLTLIIITVWLMKNKKPYLPFLLPAILLLSITTLGLLMNISVFYESKNYALMCLGVVLCVSQVWILIEAFISIRNAKNEQKTPLST